MSPHRNRLEQNIIEDNGRSAGAPGIRVRGEPDGLVFEGNTIRDARDAARKTQTIGVLIERKVGSVWLDRNAIEAGVPVEDRRPFARGSRAGANECHPGLRSHLRRSSAVWGCGLRAAGSQAASVSIVERTTPTPAADIRT